MQTINLKINSVPLNSGLASITRGKSPMNLLRIQSFYYWIIRELKFIKVCILNAPDKLRYAVQKLSKMLLLLYF